MTGAGACTGSQPASGAGQDAVPPWVAPWRQAVARAAVEPLPWQGLAGPRTDGTRRAAVLVLVGPHRPPSGAGPAGDVLLTERASDLRSHAGQVSFPGGGREAGDADDMATALREANEEVGLDPAGVEVLGTLPTLWLPPAGRDVVPVVAWWREPHPLLRLDRREVARAARAPVAELVDPGRRVGVAHPGGSTGPGFHAADMFVWGFTGGLLSWLLDLAGLSRPWDPSPRVTWRGSPLDDAAAEDGLELPGEGRPGGTRPGDGRPGTDPPGDGGGPG